MFATRSRCIVRPQSPALSCSGRPQSPVLSCSGRARSPVLSVIPVARTRSNSDDSQGSTLPPFNLPSSSCGRIQSPVLSVTFRPCSPTRSQSMAPGRPRANSDEAQATVSFSLHTCPSSVRPQSPVLSCSGSAKSPVLSCSGRAQSPVLSAIPVARTRTNSDDSQGSTLPPFNLRLPSCGRIQSPILSATLPKSPSIRPTLVTPASFCKFAHSLTHRSLGIGAPLATAATQTPLATQAQLGRRKSAPKAEAVMVGDGSPIMITT